jgi:hypothetical protein
MIIIPKISQLFWLGSATLFWQAQAPPAGLIMQMRLYQNDFAPTLTTVLGDFTECNFPGYAAKIVGPVLPNPATNVDDFAQVDFPTFSWAPTDNSNNQTVHGWYLTIIGAPFPLLLVCAERLVPGIAVNQPAAVIRVRPKLTLGSRFAS